MANEYIFLLHSFFVSGATLLCLYIGSYALVTLTALYCLLANIFVIKQIVLFGYNATGADVFTIGATLSLNMLQEYFGKQVAKQAIVINAVMLLLYIALSSIHLQYHPAAWDVTDVHFYHILAHTPRIIVASVLVSYMSQTLDYYLYAFLRSCWPTRLLGIRNMVSMLVSQLFDTVAFSFIGLYGIVEHVWQIIIISYAIKLVAIALTIPWLSISSYVARTRNRV